MAKPAKDNPLMISIAEKVGATVGLIVSKTTGAVEGASKMVEGAAKSFKPANPVPGGKRKRPAQSKAGTIKKKRVPAAAATTRKRKRPVKK